MVTFRTTFRTTHYGGFLRTSMDVCELKYFQNKILKLLESDQAKKSNGFDSVSEVFIEGFINMFGVTFDGEWAIETFFLVALCLQNSTGTLLLRQALGVWKQTFSQSAVLMLAEIIKLTFSTTSNLFFPNLIHIMSVSM